MFTNMVLGHLVGDYLFQSKDMALVKSKSGLGGFLACTFHCCLYTLIICVFIWRFDWLVPLVFLSHWPIDRWSLGGKWLRMIRGRDFLKAVDGVDVGFSCFVYAMVDNTLHLLLLRLISEVA